MTMHTDDRRMPLATAASRTSRDPAQRLKDAAANLASYALQCRALPELQTHLARVCASVLHASRVGIFEFLPDANMLVWRNGWGWPAESVCDGRVTRWQGLPIRAAIERGVVEQPTQACPFPLESLGCNAQDASFVAVVVEGRDAPWGIVTAHAGEPFAFGDDERFFLRMAANTLGAVIQGMAMEAKLNHLTHHDPLTGLPNRFGLLAALDRALAQASPAVALISLELDRFERINDVLGHKAGDAVLVATARRLRAALRESDTVARVGGDEFAVLLPGASHPDKVIAIGRKLLTQLATPFDIDGEEILATACLGIAFSSDATSGENLARHAAMALRRAKQSGANSIHCYGVELDTELEAELKLEHALRRAVSNDELVLHYQPKMAVHSGAIVGIEALVRWRHPSRGLLSPGTFIPIAEESGLVSEIDEWVLYQGMRAMRQIDRHARDLVLSINVSAPQFRSAKIVRFLESALRKTKFPPQRLELEITESAFIGNMEIAMETLEQLRCLGVRIAIDDFGAGYSSLAYLRRFPVDVLKVDRSLVQRIPDDAQDVAIARAVVALGQALHLEVVAEGVETSKQLAALHAIGCAQAQGYYVSRPLPLEALCNWLAARSPDMEDLR